MIANLVLVAIGWKIVNSFLTKLLALMYLNYDIICTVIAISNGILTKYSLGDK